MFPIIAGAVALWICGLFIVWSILRVAAQSDQTIECQHRDLCDPVYLPDELPDLAGAAGDL